jgi:hypothetical protein
MTQVSGGRADQLRHFVFHLEFAAIDFKKVFIAPVKNFGESFHRARFACSGGSEEENNSDRPSLWREACLVHLYEGHDRFERLILPD